MKKRSEHGETKTLPKFTLLLGILLLITLFNTFLYVGLNGIIPQEGLSVTILNTRKYFIEITFAIALYLYLRVKPLSYTIDIIFLGIVSNIIMGIVELAMDPTHRLSMLFPEPSSAGYYYLFVFFIILHHYTGNKKFYISRFFLVLGLAIGSKAQYALLIFVGLLKYSTIRGMVAFLLIISALFFGFKDKILSNSAVIYNKYVLETYLEGGLKEFKEENRIWGTYVTRVSGIEGAVRCLYEYPFGIGTAYNIWFSQNMPETGIDNPETNKVIEEYTATARSNLLDLFLRTGIFGILIYFYIGTWFYKIRKQRYYLYQSFLIFTLSSLFLELNPMFAYLAILVVILEKEKAQIKKEQKDAKN
ncbi:MAG: hypothetical protein L3J43_02550 [Sulfurovum sp.]|nr:hypothetical protein [Sulfurovum sp.]